MVRATLVCVVVAGVGGPNIALAQDIETRAQIAGIDLPPGYYDRIARDPDFFEIRHGWIPRLAAARATSLATTGVLPVVVIQALFADSPDPTVNAEEIQQTLFDGPAQYGTVSEFYSEMSGGRFTVSGTAVPWVRTDVTLDRAVGTSFGLGLDAGTGGYLVDALTLVDEAFDFAPFDNDGPDGVPNSGDDDGVVDAVAVQYLETAASCGGPAIWPHRSRVAGWTGSPFVTRDIGANGTPILVDDYIMQGALTCDGTAVQHITTIGHELGHVLGLPDYYDNTEGLQPWQRRWVLGCWSLMAAGSWGCGEVDRSTWTTPTHMTSYEKLQLGWIDNEIVVGPVLNEWFTLEPVQTSERVLRIPLNDVEYLLVENRQQLGFDANLPSSGVLIYHVDPEQPRRPCLECPKIYEISVVEADGNDGLKKTAAEGGNRGEAGDTFGTGGPTRFTNVTLPSTAFNSGDPSEVSFYSISLTDGVAQIRLSTTTIAVDRLLEPFLQNGAAPLTSDERLYLDDAGNANGTFDVGDFRQYLLEHPSIAPREERQ